VVHDLQTYLDRLDFSEMERVLSAGIRECVAGVARDFPAGDFYGFALDCNFSVGAIHFSFAPRSHLISVATASRMSAEDALAAVALRGKVWSLGDWPLYCVNARFAPNFVRSWQPWEFLIETVGYHELYQQTLDADLSTAFNSYLADWAAGVLLRCFEEDVFAALDRIPGFRMIVVDHDEDIDTGLDRVDRQTKASGFEAAP
jgi:hypothetical protein